MNASGVDSSSASGASATRSSDADAPSQSLSDAPACASTSTTAAAAPPSTPRIKRKRDRSHTTSSPQLGSTSVLASDDLSPPLPVPPLPSLSDCAALLASHEDDDVYKDLVADIARARARHATSPAAVASSSPSGTDAAVSSIPAPSVITAPSSNAAPTPSAHANANVNANLSGSASSPMQRIHRLGGSYSDDEEDDDDDMDDPFGSTLLPAPSPDRVRKRKMRQRQRQKEMVEEAASSSTSVTHTAQATQTRPPTTSPAHPFNRDGVSSRSRAIFTPIDKPVRPPTSSVETTTRTPQPIGSSNTPSNISTSAVKPLTLPPTTMPSSSMLDDSSQKTAAKNDDADTGTIAISSATAASASSVADSSAAATCTATPSTVIVGTVSRMTPEQIRLNREKAEAKRKQNAALKAKKSHYMARFTSNFPVPPPISTATHRAKSSDGPLSLLRSFHSRSLRVHVSLRGIIGLKSILSGYLLAFDKHFNCLMMDVEEQHAVWEPVQCGRNTIKKLKQDGVRFQIPKTKRNKGQTTPSVTGDGAAMENAGTASVNPTNNSSPAAASATSFASSSSSFTTPSRAPRPSYVLVERFKTRHFHQLYVRGDNICSVSEHKPTLYTRGMREVEGVWSPGDDAAAAEDSR